MKKRVFTLLFTIIITGGAFCQNGVVRELTGEVELKRAGASAFTAASAGETVAANTIVSTGFRSTAVIEIGSSKLTVRPLTRLSLSEIQTIENSETTSINLQAGRVRVEVNPPAGTKTNLKVQSPSTTASVRGTAFEMDADNLSVVSGKVIYAGTAGLSAMVTGGNSSFSEPDGTAADPVIIAEESLTPLLPIGVPPVITGAKTPSSGGNIIINIDY